MERETIRDLNLFWKKKFIVKRRCVYLPIVHLELLSSFVQNPLIFVHRLSTLRFLVSGNVAAVMDGLGIAAEVVAGDVSAAADDVVVVNTAVAVVKVVDKFVANNVNSIAVL